MADTISSAGAVFSRVSKNLTAINESLGVGGGRARRTPLEDYAGPLGRTDVRTKMRQKLDSVFQVPPIPGDPGYVPPPQPMTPTPVLPMPVPGQDDLSNIAARRRSIEDQMRRRGRMSTVLSNPQSEPLGG